MLSKKTIDALRALAQDQQLPTYNAMAQEILSYLNISVDDTKRDSMDNPNDGSHGIHRYCIVCRMILMQDAIIRSFFCVECENKYNPHSHSPL